MNAIRRPKSDATSSNNHADHPSTTFKHTATPSTCLTINSIPVYFPYTPYPCQTTYMTSVITALQNSQNALLESPTGTGKTLSLLCSTLAWQQNQPRSANLSSSSSSYQPQKQRKSIIIYASRTHSQLSQVLNELKSTRYRPKHALLGSREQMCVHERISKLTSGAQINFECSKLVKRRACRFRNNLEGFTNFPPTHAGEDVGREGGHQPVMDMEDLIAAAKASTICPFYHHRNNLSSDDSNDVEMVFLPYNYLFDPEARKRTLGDFRWENSVVIFDEAHNLESVASDSASFEFSNVDIAGCVGEVDRCASYLSQIGGGDGADGSSSSSAPSVENLLKLKGLFLRLESHLLRDIPPSGGSFAGGYIWDVLRQSMNVTRDTYDAFRLFTKQVSDYMMDVVGSSSSAPTPKIDAFTSHLTKIVDASSDDDDDDIDDAYRVHVTPLTTTGRTLHYWCFAPSRAMRSLRRLGVRSIIVTSGTLSPLSSYAAELGIPFDVRLTNRHVLEETALPRQVYARVVAKGVGGTELKSTYERRGTEEYGRELGSTMAALWKIVNGGVLVFFPSYGVMQTCVEMWGGTTTTMRGGGNGKKGVNGFFDPRRKGGDGGGGGGGKKKFYFPYAPTSNPNSVWKRLLAIKPILIEPRSSSDLPEAISLYTELISKNPKRGCALFGVCRGKISEGIDFRDDLARAVILTGLPFPPFKDPRVVLKREYLDGEVRKTNAAAATAAKNGSSSSSAHHRTSSLTGAEWYAQQAHRAVNQAVGRVIRHKGDYGAVLLLDARFGEPRNQMGMSQWVRDVMMPDEGIGKAISSLAKFFREAKEITTAAKDKKKKPTLVYEDDTEDIMKGHWKDDMVKKAPVAVVRNNSIADASGYVRPECVIKRFNSIPSNNANKDEMNNTPTLESLAQNDDASSHESSKNKASFGIASLYAASSSKNNLHQQNQHATSSSRSSYGRSPPPPATNTNTSSTWSNLQVNPTTPSLKRNAKRRAKEILLKRHNSHDNNNNNPIMPQSALAAPTAATSQSPPQDNNDDEPNQQLAIEFFNKAKSTISTADFSSLRTLLSQLHDAGRVKNPKNYLALAERLIRLLVPYDCNRGGGGLLSLFYPLLPLRYRSAIQSMTHKIIARRQIDKLKKRERAREGESGYLKRRAVKPEIISTTATTTINDAPPPHGTQPTTPNNPLDEKEEMDQKAALLRAREKNDAILSRVRTKHRLTNERIRDGVQKSFKSLPLGATSGGVVPPTSLRARSLLSSSQRRGRGRQMGGTMMSLLNDDDKGDERKLSSRIVDNDNKKPSTTPKKIGNDNNATTTPADPITQCLASITSPFLTPHSKKRRQQRDNKRRKSNVPPGAKCAICRNTLKKPFMANCGHSACLDCWIKWFEASMTARRKKAADDGIDDDTGDCSTCMVCRRGVKREELVRMVFDDGDGGGGGEDVTLSQICWDGDEDDEGEDDELVII